MEKIRCAIIGMGRMGKTRYKYAKLHGGYEVVGICDSDPSKLVDYPELAFNNWDECLEQCAPDAVFVCTVNALIPDIVCFALAHDIHVFSEKPPGRNKAEALRMKRCGEDYPSAVLKFGFNHRYHNSVIEAKALVDSGLLGEVVCARGVYGKAGSNVYSHDWRNNVSLSGGGILLDQGIHMLDLLRYFMGGFSRVQSCVNNLVWKELPAEDSAFAILETVDGRAASLHSSILQWRHKFDLDIMCTGGYIALNGLLTSTRSYGEELLTYCRKDLSATMGKLGRPLEHTMCFGEDNSWAIEMREFYHAVADGVPIQNGTPEDAVAVMELVEKVYNLGRANMNEGEL